MRPNPPKDDVESFYAVLFSFIRIDLCGKQIKNGLIFQNRFYSRGSPLVYGRISV